LPPAKTICPGCSSLRQAQLTR
jgi:hypothetical protein